nr:glycosyltransferase family 2 protein [Actinomadura rugatobispora]
MRVLTVLQAAAAVAVAARLARGRGRPAPLARPAPPVAPPDQRISVVIPARNEEDRIAGCLVPLLKDPAVGEVIVVNDESRDETARLAERLGATVVRGRPLPAGWVGKQWALHQGVAAAAGPVVVLLDADTRPEPGLCTALAERLRTCDLVTAGPRFLCGGVAEQALHASFLAGLVYRFGPIGPAAPSPDRILANGQCMAFRKDAMVEADGFARVRRHLTDDVALARLLARDGWRVGFVDAGALLGVDMHESAAQVWREWGRSLPLRDVTAPDRLVLDVAVLWLTTALPVLRLAAGRPTPLDLGLLAQRLLLAAALRGSYAGPRLGLALSPLLDVATAVRLTQAAVRPVRTWRGRTYGDDAVSPPGLGRAAAGLVRGAVPPARPARNAAR